MQLLPQPCLVIIRGIHPILFLGYLNPLRETVYKTEQGLSRPRAVCRKARKLRFRSDQNVFEDGSLPLDYLFLFYFIFQN
jgi:hypothetical protein